MNFPEYLPLKYFPTLTQRHVPTHASTETHTYRCTHTIESTHTHQALCEVIEAFIQMVMSWGTGLPEELLFLVRENRED